jgi:hypothetical protein
MPTPAPTPATAPEPGPTAQPPVPVPEAPQPAPASYPDLEPVPEWDAVRVEREAGTTWNIVGDGYAPGAEIFVTFGPMSTDANLLDEPVVYAGANGHYSLPITLAPDLAPGTYGFMVVAMPFSEAGKRFATVEVLAPAGK